VAGGFSAKEFRNISARQPISRPDGADVVFGESVAGFHIFYHKKGAAEDVA